MDQYLDIRADSIIAVSDDICLIVSSKTIGIDNTILSFNCDVFYIWYDSADTSKNRRELGVY